MSALAPALKGGLARGERALAEAIFPEQLHPEPSVAAG